MQSKDHVHTCRHKKQETNPLEAHTAVKNHSHPFQSPLEHRAGTAPMASAGIQLLWDTAPVLAETELIFLTVACMGLCLGFVLQTVLIAQGCFSYC